MSHNLREPSMGWDHHLLTLLAAWEALWLCPSTHPCPSMFLCLELPNNSQGSLSYPPDFLAFCPSDPLSHSFKADNKPPTSERPEFSISLFCCCSCSLPNLRLLMTGTFLLPAEWRDCEGHSIPRFPEPSPQISLAVWVTLPGWSRNQYIPVNMTEDCRW